VQRVAIDREAENAAGTFGERIAALEADVVIDMICFDAAGLAHIERHDRPRPGLTGSPLVDAQLPLVDPA
jgi:hypothetical protein